MPRSRSSAVRPSGFFYKIGENNDVNKLRTAGAVIAVASMAFGGAFAIGRSAGQGVAWPLDVLLVLLAFLGYILWIYGRLTADLIVPVGCEELRARRFDWFPAGIFHQGQQADTAASSKSECTA